MKVIITESQLKYLIAEQAAQKIKVTDYCGRTKEVDYRNWYYDISEYNPYGSNNGKARKDLNAYTLDGTAYTAKFNGKWSYFIPNFDSITKEEQELAKKKLCEKPASERYGGSYKSQPNLITAVVKDIKSFSNWLPQTIQEWVDWITWFLESFGGPQGKTIATMAEAIQGIGYLMFAESQKTLKGYVQYVIEGIGKLLSAADIKIKIPGLSDWLDRIVKYVESIGFSSIISNLAAKGAKINSGFDKQPKWIQAVITLLLQAGGSYVLTGLNWITTNIIKPIYNLIKEYNSTLAEYIKSFIDYLVLFLSLADTASLIVTDLNKKGIITKIK